MPSYTQANRPLAITTPLGEDVLLLTGIKGAEEISQLFSFQLELLAEPERNIQFDGIVGQNVTVELRLAGDDRRYFNGIVKRFSQGGRGESFIHYRAEMVPKVWLLTKKVRSRIFQHITVPDILREVLAGFDVTYEILGNYYQRDYCVQYRESDFNFLSRLMEEEGIYYFFKHADNAHKMVVTDVANQHPAVPVQSEVIYQDLVGGLREDMRVTSWEKAQELRSGAYTLWDHCFELPTNHLEAREKTIDAVKVGKATHKLQVAGNDKLEIYDYPGGYAQRFDGIDKSGGPRPQDLKDIFKDSERTARIRMEQEEVEGLSITGTSNCGHFSAGHRFALERHFDADDQYLLTRVEHDGHLSGSYDTQAEAAFEYENRFTCIPAALPYRPQRVTPKPVIAGIQTATVVGPPGEELFCDKYGRIKVQFHWDREGTQTGDSSCWLRVAQVWAGKGWGAFFWPRIGHEVVVTFEEGDPDQPMIIGSVYNADNMPWFALPANKNLAGFKSASFRGTSRENFNGVVFNDTKGHEHLQFYSERHMSFNSELDKVFHAGRHKGERVASANVLTVGNLPIGGGSGGGFDDNDAKPIQHPPPTEVPGLNSVFVYGENLQVAVGLNHQLALGNNLQVCVNPLGLVAGVPGMPGAPAMTSLVGAMGGGNTQFTIGSNVQFVLGQSFDINLGPPKIEVKSGPGGDDPAGNYGAHIATDILCGVIGIAVLVWVILYGTTTDDKDRANYAMIFQMLIDALLAAVLVIEVQLDHVSKETREATQKLFRATDDSKRIDANQVLGLLTTVPATLALLAAVEAPIIATGSEASGQDTPRAGN
ncbi:MAG TPA: type VI secretion system tip protein TssI/VgrG [Terriglobales bacterium]|nr:type VI secretion system tip protein TssI/VgrG [Terriglobales bacterium]